MDLRRALIAAVNAFCDELERAEHAASGPSAKPRRRTPRMSENLPPPEVPVPDEVTRRRVTNELRRIGLDPPLAWSERKP